MTDKVIENNQVIIMGKIVSDFTFSHEIFGEGFYMVDVEVARLSDSYDIIPLMVSEGSLMWRRTIRALMCAYLGSSGPITATRRERTD